MVRSKAMWLLLVALAATLVGCTNFFYNRLDTLAAWYVQDLVSLDDGQRNDLRSWLDATLQWHRRSELTRYVKFLRELANTAARPGNTATYQSIEQQVDAFTSRVIDKAVPDAARMLLSLTPKQLDEFQANLADKARERNSKSLEALEDGTWHEKRAKGIEKQLKRWTGSVTKEQKQLIAQHVQRLESTASDWIESQERWRQAMFGALRERFTANESPAQVEQRILPLLRTPESQWTQAYMAKSTRNREQSLVALAALDASLTTSQRTHLQGELTELAGQLEGMVER
ncbi:MAG: DUF6279 family lipoprotein [Steroidobacter sp.]